MALTPEELQEQKKALFEKARKGVLKFLNEKGGQSSLGDLHDFSLNRYLIQHQAFSQLMETLVEQKLVEYDFEKDLAAITEAGRDFNSDG